MKVEIVKMRFYTHHKLSAFILVLYCIVLITPTEEFSLNNCTIPFPFEYSDNPKVLCYKMGYRQIPSLLPFNTIILDISFNSISQISESDFIRLPNLINLNMSHNRISEIHSSALSGLPNLEELNLSNNKIKTVSTKLLSGLVNLSHLRLDSNYLETIENLSFASLSNLRVVNLTNNKLNHISRLQPILTIPYLEELYLGNNSFTVFNSSNVPSALSTLKKLDLSFNPLTMFKITENIFPGLEYLDLSYCFQNCTLDWIILDKAFLNAVKTLNISSNHISEKQLDNIMQSFTSVTWIDINDMKEFRVQTILQEACSPGLRSLQFRNNNLSVLTDHMFRPCELLNELHLRNNGVSEMYTSTFENLKNLTVLRLQNNLLTQLNNTLQVLPKLQLLDLHLNNIANLKCSDFVNLTQLRQLFLHKNRILTIKACLFKDLANLDELILDSNSLITISDAFTYGPPNLRYLNLNGNKLSSVKKDSFKALHSLKVLYLADNPIVDIQPSAFAGMIHLSELLLSSLKITEITLRNPNIFVGITRLQGLDLSCNYLKYERHEELDNPPFVLLSELKILHLFNQREGLKHIPSNLFKGLMNLQVLYAGNLNIEYLHFNTFIHTPKLQYLDLSSNNFAGKNALTSRLFYPIKGLNRLTLGRVHLQSLDFLTEANLSSLNTLRASGNELQLINQTLIQSLPRLKILDLQNNRFICDCSNAWFIDWAVKNNNTQVIYLNRYKCCYPLSLSGMNLVAINTESCNVNYDFISFIVSFSTTILTLIISFIYHFLKWQLVYAYYLFLAFLNDRKRKLTKNHLGFQYDAFISYNVQDEPWVLEELVPKLEVQQGLRLCLHHRDFQPGKAIIDNIVDGIYNSRKTVCLITHNYLRSVWCSHEIQVASFRLFDEQKDVLVLVFLEEIPTHHLSPYYRMRKLVNKWTYLQWPKQGEDTRVFWQKLIMAIKTKEAMQE
ncbi:toll-like receptor 13 [Myxocyprinus asiaticus]|uniref:toll-like receptor 13 n=1 Tax=Myxocyprinus asiaticus TaxID=70543 RepID=UPI0022214F37|nr:toll-like receptor 13 [Myxocyprinus asiaticus]